MAVAPATNQMIQMIWLRTLLTWYRRRAVLLPTMCSRTPIWMQAWLRLLSAGPPEFRETSRLLSAGPPEFREMRLPMSQVTGLAVIQGTGSVSEAVRYALPSPLPSPLQHLVPLSLPHTLYLPNSRHEARRCGIYALLSAAPRPFSL